MFAVCLVASTQLMTNQSLSRSAFAQEATAGKPLGRYLAEMGDRWDIDFTFETRGERWGAVRSFFADARVGKQGTPNSLPDSLDELRRNIKGYRVFKNPDNSAVIHIVDERLLADKNFVMNQRVSLQFDGVLGCLPDAIDKEVDGKMSSPIRIGPDAMFGPDDSTRVKLKAERWKVRRILTQPFPLKGYNRLIWTAETYPLGGKPVTFVWYRGPKDMFPHFPIGP